MSIPAALRVIQFSAVPHGHHRLQAADQPVRLEQRLRRRGRGQPRCRRDRDRDRRIPISSEQDTPGPMARNVTDAAILLDVIDGANQNYADALDPGALQGARIGVWMSATGDSSPEVDALFQETIARLQQLGATGYPKVSVPMGYVGVLPIGMSVFAGAGDDATVLGLAYAWEQATRVRRAPTYLPTTG